MTRQHSMGIAVLGLLLLCGGRGVAQEAVPVGPSLDGKTFVGETGEEGKPAGAPETFVFADGKLDPLECHRSGFQAGAYTAEAEGETVIFSAETLSPKQGKMRWSGTVLGDQLEGVMSWYKGKKLVKHWFRGKLKA
jgi:hypothetical protein